MFSSWPIKTNKQIVMPKMSLENFISLNFIFNRPHNMALTPAPVNEFSPDVHQILPYHTIFSCYFEGWTGSWYDMRCNKHCPVTYCYLFHQCYILHPQLMSCYLYFYWIRLLLETGNKVHTLIKVSDL